jgi:hypothetical protein
MDGKVNELIDRAEKAGIRLEFDSGLNVAKLTESGDPDGQCAILAELWKHLSEVRRLIEARAIGARAKKFVGQRIFCEFGEGTLVGASYDGILRISTSREIRHVHEEDVHSSQVTLASNAQGLLIVLVDDGPETGASSPDNEPQSEQPRPGFFDRLRGSRKD